MMIKIISLCVCLLALACTGFAQSENQAGYIGSWSNGRAFQMSVNDATIEFDSKGNTAQKYQFRDITPAEGISGGDAYFLEITSPAKEAYFSKFISVAMSADESRKMNELTVTNYDSLADLKAGRNPQGSDTWFRDGASFDDENAAVSGTLQVGKTESVILYFGEESGDYAGYCFMNDSEAGKKILAACKDGEKCEVVGEIDGESPCKVPGLEADLSASGKIMSVKSVKSLAVKTKAAKDAKPAAAAANTPDQLVRDLYAAQKTEATNPFIQTKNRASVDKYFTRELGDVIWKTAASDTGYNFDPLYNAQDTDISDFVVEKADENNTVKVKFKNFGKAEEITFFLTKENTASKAWKIDSVMYSNAEDLGSLLEYGLMSDADIEAAGAENKLDGDYLVGTVKCTITTNLSGFWARVKCDDQEDFQVIDTETLTFGTFNPNEKGRKGRFVSPEYGVIEKFVDASGKEFKVSRVK